MKFDVIIGNPPYQFENCSRPGDNATPLYNLFIERCIELSPEYLSFIIPSRWTKGGRGLHKFRQLMTNDLRIKEIHDFQNNKDIFTDIRLDDGVMYFLWQANYTGKTYYNYITKDNQTYKSKRFLNNVFIDIVIRDHRQLSIVEKVQKHIKLTNGKDFSTIVSSQRPYGFRSDLFNNPGRYPSSKFSQELSVEGLSDFVKIYGVQGHKFSSKRSIGYVSLESVKRNKESIYKYKLFFSKAFFHQSTTPPKIIKGGPNEICTETFLKIGDFDTKDEMDNCVAYMETKFFKALFFFARASFNVSKQTFSLIPLVSFSKPLSAEELYCIYELNKEEISYIEEIIK